MENIDLLFERVDYVAYFGLVGGEPTLNPDLGRILAYIGEKYGDKCGRLTFVINGTRKLSCDVLSAMKKHDVYLLISDYTEFVPYDGSLEDLTREIDGHGLEYDVRHSQVWSDFGFPSSPAERTKEETAYHLRSCHPEWNGLNDGKFYYCNISWSAEKSGKFELNMDDYIGLKKINANDKEACRSIVNLSRGSSSFCRICGGCGRDNTDYVPVGLQVI